MSFTKVMKYDKNPILEVLDIVTFRNDVYLRLCMCVYYNFHKDFGL